MYANAASNGADEECDAGAVAAWAARYTLPHSPTLLGFRSDI
jgi:hypothetical protein